ncbi:MAG: DMT family transporter [Caulobacter sp.]|nr:DMT family transporter [Caulobacter sp.]
MDSNGRILIGVGNGVAAGAVWGLVFLAPQLLKDFSAPQISAGRYLAYGLIAALLLAPRWRAVAAMIARAEWTALVGLSLLGNILYYVLLANAVWWAGGAASALIVGLVPVVVSVAGTRLAGAVRFRRLAGPLALCLLGVLLVGWEALANDKAAHDPLTRLAGLACAFGALISWTAYSVWNNRWLERRPDISGHDWSLLTGLTTGALALVLAVPAFLAPGQAAHGAEGWWLFLGVSAGIAILASILGNGFWNRASRLLPMTLAGQMIVFETLFALLYGFVWERRLPTGLEIVAIAALIAGVVWCARVHRVKEHGAA